MTEPGVALKPLRPVQWLRRPWVWVPLAAIALFLFWRLGWLETGFDFLRGDWPQAQARIYVEPPQVYTRERLVNDRFREINWLEQRLRSLESVAERGPSQITDTRVETRVGVAAAGGGGQAALPSVSDGSSQSPAQSSAPMLDQLDAFNLDFERRLAVRSEMLNTLLDDGHDLAGATLYRMNFDVSVIPRPDARGFGLVAIDVESNGCAPSTRLSGGCFSLAPEARLAQRVRAYRRLLASWEQDLQGFLSKVYQDRTDFPPETLIDPFGGSPKERIAFNWYVKAMAVEYWLGLVAGSDCAANKAEPCGGDEDSDAYVDNGGSTPHDWASNAAVRRDRVRQALAVPGSATLLPGDLSANLQRIFAKEVRRYGGQVLEKVQRRALVEFRGAFQAALDACPPPSGWGPPQQEQSAPDQTVPGRAASGCGPRPMTDAGAEKAWPSPFKAMRLAGLRLLEADEGCIDDPPSCQQSDLNELFARIQNSPACRSARPTLPWDKGHRHEIPCPPQWTEQTINLYGMVRLASQLRTLHELLVKPASAGQRDPVLPLLPPEFDHAAIVERSIGLYGCLLPDPDREQEEGAATSGAAPACMSWLQPDDPVRKRFLQLVRQMPSSTADEVEQFKAWFAAFFVDRLRRSDIPGFQPSPSIDRFFSIGEVGCDTGACNVMVDRRRWLGTEDWEEIGARLQAQLRQFWAGAPAPDPSSPKDGPEQRQAEIDNWLKALLPSTHQLCRDDNRGRCLDILRSSLAVAKQFEVQRITLPPADFRSNADAYRAGVTYDYRCNARKVSDVPDPSDDIAAVCTAPLSNLEQRVSWDFAQTVTALALEQRLDEIDGEITIYTVEPRVKSLVDQTAVKQTLRLQAALDAFPEAAGDRRLDAARDVAERLERIGARPTVVGFGYLRGGGSEADAQRRASFGWLFLPNEFAPGGLFGQGRATHRPATHRLSAVLSVPSWWTGLRLTVRQCWGQFGLIDRAVIRDPYRIEVQCDGTEVRSGLAPAGRTVYPIELPASTERITEVFDFEVIKVPYINHRAPHEVARVEAGRRGRVVIQGGRLWRGTMVTLDDQQADQITVLPDMKGVVATFNCVLPPAGQRHFTSNARVESPVGDPADGPSNARLTVWTAQGNDSTQTLVWPFKQRIPGELPCWLDQAPTASGAPAGDSKTGAASSRPAAQQMRTNGPTAG